VRGVVYHEYDDDDDDDDDGDTAIHKWGGALQMGFDVCKGWGPVFMRVGGGNGGIVMMLYKCTVSENPARDPLLGLNF
jgi:hypothetical protein